MTESNIGQQPPAFNLDSNPIAGQTASAVLDLNGQIVQGGLSPSTASILFSIMQESAQLPLAKKEAIQRVTVTLENCRYVLARDDTHLYIAQTKIA